MKIVQLSQSDVAPIRELIAEEQNGECPVCLGELRDPCLDHSHIKRLKGTGLVRGVLCRTCNSFLGKIENNCVRNRIALPYLPEVLENIAAYLRSESLPYYHPEKAKKKKRKGVKKK